MHQQEDKKKKNLEDYDHYYEREIYKDNGNVQAKPMRHGKQNRILSGNTGKLV